MIVGICGLGYSGSGAVTALLKEYKETQVFSDFEFNFSYIPDGLEDLEYHLMKHCARYYDSDVALRRYLKFVKRANTKRSALRRVTYNKIVPLTKNYIDDITQLKWSGFWEADMTHVSRLQYNFNIRLLSRVYKLIFKLTHKHHKILPNRTMYMSVAPQNFYDRSKKYINDILKMMGRDASKITVLDQPFSGDRPQNSFPFYDDPKAIIIDRDPRDLYLVAKRIGSVVGRFMPADDVETFVEYYKLLRKNIDENEDKGKILRLRFEDLIYEYDKTVAQIEEFIGIKEHTAKKQFFKPQVSINNTQLFRIFPENERDVKYIEENLKEYLYPFEDYPSFKHTGKSF